MRAIGALLILGQIGLPVRAAPDPIARGLAVQAKKAAAAAGPTAFTKSTLFVIWGQSTERGQGKRYIASLGVATSVAAYIPTVARSAANRQQDPIAPARSRYTSAWPSMIDTLAGAGVDADVVNAAVGSISIEQLVGVYKQWFANTSYAQLRSSEGNGDAGYKGDLIVAGGKVWRCTVGQKTYATLTNASPAVVISGTATTDLDAIATGPAVLSGSTAPNWASVTTVGGTISDGALTWTLVENSTAHVVDEAFAGTNPDFDPAGMIARGIAAATTQLANKRYDEVVAYFANGQGDVSNADSGTSQLQVENRYRLSLKTFVDYISTVKGWKVMIGLSSWNPQIAGALNSSVNRFKYDTLDRAWDRLFLSYQGNANIIRGANLYRIWGFSPPTYPEAAAPIGLHLTEAGEIQRGQLEAAAYLAGVSGAISAPAAWTPYPPQIIGTGTVGQTLTLNYSGAWTGGYNAISQAWYRDGAAISGATAGSYVLVSADSGHTITCVVTASNPLGAASAASNGIAVG